MPVYRGPLALAIPSLEYRYETVTFKPTSLQPFAAVFAATIDKGTDSRSKTLTFEMRVEGTLRT